MIAGCLQLLSYHGLAILEATVCSLSFIFQGEIMTNRILQNFECTSFLPIDFVSSSNHYDIEIVWCILFLCTVNPNSKDKLQYEGYFGSWGIFTDRLNNCGYFQLWLHVQNVPLSSVCPWSVYSLVFFFSILCEFILLFCLSKFPYKWKVSWS